MEDHAAPLPEPTTDAARPAESLSPGRRRVFLKSLLGTTLGGVLGYQSHSWVLGEKQDEVVETVRSFLKKMRQMRESPAPRRGRQPGVVTERPSPLRLDAEGQDYQSFLSGLGLRHIRPMEMIRPHFNVRGTVCNCLPPREAWRNIAPTLRVADELRQQLGSRLTTILSAYRSPAYNAACPGAAAHSYHMRNMALDLAFDCPPEEVAKAAEALRDKGFFKGGIGRYATFTHIDTRGHKADWG